MSDLSESEERSGGPCRSRIGLIAFGCCLIFAMLIASAALRHHARQAPSRATAEPRERLDTPYIPSPTPIVEAMVDMADLDSDDVVYDLGCGDGRILIAAARQAGCRAVGFDIDPNLVREARENVRAAGLEHLITIQRRDVLTVDLSQATVVTVYLLPWILERLIPQFDAMDPGSRIVSHDFRIAGCEPDKTIQVSTGGPDSELRRIHLWITPLRHGTAAK